MQANEPAGEPAAAPGGLEQAPSTEQDLTALERRCRERCIAAAAPALERAARPRLFPSLPWSRLLPVAVFCARLPHPSRVPAWRTGTAARGSTGAATTAAACASSRPAAARSSGAGTATTKPRTPTSRWVLGIGGSCRVKGWQPRNGGGGRADGWLHLQPSPPSVGEAPSLSSQSSRAGAPWGPECPTAGLAEKARAGPQGDNRGVLRAVQHTPGRRRGLHRLRRRVWCARGPAGQPFPSLLLALACGFVNREQPAAAAARRASAAVDPGLP